MVLKIIGSWTAAIVFIENHEDEFNTQYSNSIEECNDNMHLDYDSWSVNILDDGKEKRKRYQWSKDVQDSSNWYEFW